MKIEELRPRDQKSLKLFVEKFGELARISMPKERENGSWHKSHRARLMDKLRRENELTELISAYDEYREFMSTSVPVDKNSKGRKFSELPPAFERTYEQQFGQLVAIRMGQVYNGLVLKLYGSGNKKSRHVTQTQTPTKEDSNINLANSIYADYVASQKASNTTFFVPSDKFWSDAFGIKENTARAYRSRHIGTDEEIVSEKVENGYVCLVKRTAPAEPDTTTKAEGDPEKAARLLLETLTNPETKNDMVALFSRLLKKE